MKLASEYILEMRDITKKYGENAVLSGVSLKVKPGEIHALLGENGAGKSTLMNVLFGMPVIHETGGFGGEVYLNGEKTTIASPHDAMTKGIGMVHQEFMLLPGFTITENIKLNREISRPSAISRVFGKNLETLDMKAMSQDARGALDSVGMSIDEDTLVAGLPVGYMQFVEIAREIDKKGVKLLVFDEPTAVLTESEAAQLLKVMKDIAARGIAIIFITHRLDEVINAADVANAHEFIARQPDAYDSMLGERGVGLSGGEKQRISIARAVLMNPSILIFDEATAAVDSETENLIQEAIERLISGRTTLMIAHRLSTLRKANKIIVVDQGRIIECGSHDELMALGGKYHRLIEIQSMSEKLRKSKEEERFD